MPRLIRGLSFLQDNVVIEYASDDDVRSNGLMLQHALSIPATDEYGERLDELVSVVQALLDAALRDAQTYPPATSAVDEDDPSPYDHPDDGGLPA